MIYCIPVRGVFETNCYLYADGKTRHAFLIDPGAQANELLKLIKDNHFIVEKILLTHGHFDHIGAVNRLRKELGVPVYAHKKSDDYLMNPVKNLSVYYDPITVSNAKYLYDGDVITLEANPSMALKVIETPGHTEDSIVLHSEKDKFAFVGDTIFQGSIGNYTYPGGSRNDLFNSIKNKIFTLPDDTVLLSGHSAQTTVIAEKQNI